MGDILTLTCTERALFLGFMDTRVRTLRLKKLMDLVRFRIVCIMMHF